MRLDLGDAHLATDELAALRPLPQRLFCQGDAKDALEARSPSLACHAGASFLLFANRRAP
jgi:hypothetical protein